jgi:hypothetical protein
MRRARSIGLFDDDFAFFVAHSAFEGVAIFKEDGVRADARGSKQHYDGDFWIVHFASLKASISIFVSVLQMPSLFDVRGGLFWLPIAKFLTACQTKV